MLSTGHECGLGRRLEGWTQKASCVARTDSSAAVSALQRLVRRALATAAGRRPERIALASLPPCALRLIGVDIYVRDLIALSHTCRALRAQLLRDPEVWRDLTRLYGTPVSSNNLVHLVPRSEPATLILRLLLDAKNIVPRADVLRAALPRAAALTIRAPCTPLVEWRLRRELCEPAPMLSSLTLLLTTPGTPVRESSALFAGCAPRLRTCVLFNVPTITLLSAAFRNLVTLDYGGAVGAVVVSDILESLPLLATLGLRVSSSPSPPPGMLDLPAPHGLRLKRLLLDFRRELRYAPSGLNAFRNIPFDALQHLVLMRNMQYACDVLSLYAVDGISVGLNGWHVRVANSAPRTVIQVYPFVYDDGRPVNVYAPELWTRISWLSIHEYLWSHDEPPPPLPNVTTLCVCLATPTTRVPVCYGTVSDGGIFAVLPGAEWHMPRLREVRLTAPRSDTTRGPPSVALADVRWFVRAALAFDAARLYTLRLAGLRVVDFDFCAGWADVCTVVEHVVLEEHPDAEFYQDIPDHFNDVLTTSLDEYFGAN